MAIPVEDRCRAIEHGLSLIREGVPAREAWAQAAQGVGATPSTLYRWYQKVHGQGRSQWAGLLEPRYAGRALVEISPAAWECYLSAYRSGTHPSMKEAYRATRRRARTEGWAIPGEGAFRRRVNRLGLRLSRYRDTG